MESDNGINYRYEMIQKRFDRIDNMLNSIDERMKKIENANHFVRIQCENARKDSLYFDNEEEEEEDREKSHCLQCSIF